MYWLSKRSAMYRTAGRMRNAAQAGDSLGQGATVGTGLGQSGFATGIRNSF